MSNPSLRIARAGKEIGVHPLEEVRRRLADGNLLTTDHYWTPGMAAWATLAELPGPVRQLPFPRPLEKEAGFIDGILGRQDSHAGLIRLWDKLASAPRECLVDDATMAAIDAEVGYVVRKRCRKELKAWYRQAVEAYLSDRYFAPEEKDNLKNLERTFGLTSAETLELHGDAFASYFNIGFQTCMLRDIPLEEKGREIALLTRLVPLPAEKIA
ncbi:MAG: domain 2, partial [Verrucomicrobiota bacterium]